ncbi:MAG: HIT family hydrolase [Lentisphaerae bacterium GWF2_52_8]|nr:MAG: HIT family hydrolase [Lentisphaerae bacterium GWF2_52_8]
MGTAKRPLWAPWRIEFIRSKKDGCCFLCDKRRPDSESREEELVIFRGKTVFVILNRYPYNSGHLMIAPYRHIGDISELGVAERRELMDITIESKELLSKLMRPEGFNVGFNLGLAGGAGVADHIHMHVVPRWQGDTNFMPVLCDTRIVPESLVETARLLRSAWPKARRKKS